MDTLNKDDENDHHEIDGCDLDVQADADELFASGT